MRRSKKYMWKLYTLVFRPPIPAQNEFHIHSIAGDLNGSRTRHIHNFRYWCCRLIKTSFGPTGHHHHWSNPLPHVSTIPSASATFIVHPVSCVLWGCSAPAAILPWSPQLCRNGRLSVLSSIFNIQTEKSMVGGGQQSCCFLSNIPLWKRKCETVCCCDATASSFIAKVRGKVFAHFHTVAIKHHSSLRNWLVGLPGRILCEQSPSCKKNMSMLFTFPFACLALFCLDEFGSFHQEDCCFVPGSPVITMDKKCASSEVIWQSSLQTFTHCCFWLAPRNHIWPDTRPQIQGRKNLHVHLAAWNFVC
jgi:hypothetical protein